VSQVDPRVPHSWSAQVAWGDYIAGALALAAIATLRSGGGMLVAWVATIVGLLDFANSFGRGTLLGVTDLPLGFVWYIAVGAVPPLFAAHLLALRLLLKGENG
jgi:hypothetical protein